MNKCEFTFIERHSHSLASCPLCGSAAELWECCDDYGVQKFVACGRPAEMPLGSATECPLSMPPRQDFYMPTLREAASAWNSFAAAAIESRAALGNNTGSAS